jgi:hypothetical protein
LVAGEGEGTERKTATIGSVTGIDRREFYTDARDISSKVDETTLTDEEYSAQLIQRGIEKLNECTTVMSYEGQADTDTMFRYGEDFLIGDIVQLVSAYGIESTAQVTEIVRSQSTSGIEVYPTFAMI